MAQCHSACHGRGGDLAAHRELIQELYVGQDQTAKSVADHLQGHGIIVSEIFIKKKIRGWHIRKRKAGLRDQGVDNIEERIAPPTSWRSRKGKWPLAAADSTSDPRLEALRLAVNRQSLVNIKVPDMLGLAEGMFHACQHYSMVQLKQWANEVNRDHEPNDLARYAAFSFMLATDKKHATDDNVRRGALLEQGFRDLDTLIHHERHESPALFHAFLVILGQIRYTKAPKVLEQLFLRHIAAATAIAFRPYHPIAVFARNMLALPLSSELLMVLMGAFVDAHRQSLGPGAQTTKIAVDHFGALMHKIRRESMTPDEIIAWHERIIAQDKGIAAELYHVTIKHESYATSLMEFGRWDEAVELLRPAPRHAQMNLDYRAAGGDLHGGKTLAIPVSLINSLSRMRMLAEALVGQGKKQLAGRPVFEVPEVQERFNEALNLSRTAISLSIQHLGRDHPETSELRGGYARILERLDLEEDASAVYAEWDESLAAFKLTPFPELDASTEIVPEAVVAN